MRDLIGENGTCLERKCVIEFQGKTFENAGAFLGINKNGKHGGVVYGDWKNTPPREITNWHGDIKVYAQYGPMFRGNMGDRRRHVWFTWKGISYHGVWCGIDSTQIIRVREMKGN